MNLISIEKNKEPDLFEDEKIIRKDRTNASLTLTALFLTRMHAIEPIGELPLIEHEKIIQKDTSQSFSPAFPKISRM